ncbi:hypothetical protein VTH8203_03994 [Vibrio thalassae]|uniref:Uncharacterized protein n=1 Tax=Vibrio thalassae TaxID=1243014 RepID=A0A240EQC8_9VIBR|nr:hypothetical protein VTH8203_03994 [Vibrio thalassae]
MMVYTALTLRMFLIDAKELPKHSFFDQDSRLDKNSASFDTLFFCCSVVAYLMVDDIAFEAA